MIVSITLNGQDLVELIEQKISNEVSKHGHPASFDIQTLLVQPRNGPRLLMGSLLQEHEVVAVATPKTAQAPK